MTIDSMSLNAMTKFTPLIPRAILRVCHQFNDVVCHGGSLAWV
jgi:hypothetical protein